MQHFLHHLAPRGAAGFVLANGSMSSNQSNEGENIVEADLVDCIIALPGQLFRSTQIAACSGFSARAAAPGRVSPARPCSIDARKLGHMVDRAHRDLSAEDIARIAGAYHAWRDGTDAIQYANVPGFCKSATLEEIRRHSHVLTPGRYVGREQQAEARRLDAAIAENLKRLGFG